MNETGNERKRPARTNGLYWLAVAIFAAMIVLSFPFWLSQQTGPVVFGMPIAFTYHVGYCVAAVPVLWLLFKAIWPPSDDSSGD